MQSIFITLIPAGGRGTGKIKWPVIYEELNVAYHGKKYFPNMPLLPAGKGCKIKMSKKILPLKTLIPAEGVDPEKGFIADLSNMIIPIFEQAYYIIYISFLTLM